MKGRHTFKAGVSFEYSGEDDFDQINVNSIPGGTNNQNGQFEFRNNRDRQRPDTGTALADMAMGTLQNYAEIGERAFTKWRALATDIFVQDSWKPTQQPDDRGRPALGHLAAVVLDHEQHRQLRPEVL